MTENLFGLPGQYKNLEDWYMNPDRFIHMIEDLCHVGGEYKMYITVKVEGDEGVFEADRDDLFLSHDRKELVCVPFYTCHDTKRFPLNRITSVELYIEPIIEEGHE